MRSFISVLFQFVEIKPRHQNSFFRLILHYNNIKEVKYIASSRTWLQYKLKRCSKKKCWNNVNIVKFNDTMTKWPVQKQAQYETKNKT